MFLFTSIHSEFFNLQGENEWRRYGLHRKDLEKRKRTHFFYTKPVGQEHSYVFLEATGGGEAPVCTILRERTGGIIKAVLSRGGGVVTKGGDKYELRQALVSLD